MSSRNGHDEAMTLEDLKQATGAEEIEVTDTAGKVVDSTNPSYQPRGGIPEPQPPTVREELAHARQLLTTMPPMDSTLMTILRTVFWQSQRDMELQQALQRIDQRMGMAEPDVKPADGKSRP